jgi:lipopolysaccharide/colanic/teichoic acid biosynthesis glycosyltransferase
MELSRAAVQESPRAVPRLTVEIVSPPDRLRRSLDVVVAVALLIVASPILIGGALWVFAVDGGPVLFGHRRVGRGGRSFRCWKLRTMKVDAERILEDTPDLLRLHRQNDFKLPALRDPRIVRGGRFLRRTHLDELPQLVNLLVGDMTLVGPRPVVEDELDRFGDGIAALVSVRPGIFGAWTSLGRRRPIYPERARIEIDGVRRRGFVHDFRILLRSVGVVLRGQEEG